MARFYPSGGAGGGADTSVVTAVAGDVLSGKVIVDAEGNPLTGTMDNHSGQSKGADSVYFSGDYFRAVVKYPGYYDNESSIRVGKDSFGDATQADVLTGKKFTSADGLKINGSMPDNGAVAPSALAAGGSYTIPAGYHNGSGKVTVQSLATMTASGDATAAQILSGKKAYVDGNLITGTIASKAAATYYATTSDQTIAASQYLSGAQTIKKLTQTNLTAANILKGKTITINNGNANVWSVAGSLAVTSAINFKATAQSHSTIRISWTNPSKGPWEGVEIRMSTSGNPGVSGGTQKYKGKGNNATAGGSNYVDITGLSYATTYYFTCTSYASGLGNGSSYNVSAKTADLVLWNGSSVQNGAVIDDDILISYVCSGSVIKTKKLVLKLKRSYSNSRLTIGYLTTDGGGGTNFGTSDGNIVSSTKNTLGSWTGGVEYVFNLSQLTNVSIVKELDYIYFENADDTYKLVDAVAYIAIR